MIIEPLGVWSLISSIIKGIDRRRQTLWCVNYQRGTNLTDY